MNDNSTNTAENGDEEDSRCQYCGRRIIKDEGRWKHRYNGTPLGEKPRHVASPVSQAS